MVFGLRLVEGIDRALLDGTDDAAWRGRVDDLLAKGLLEERAGRVRLTDFGRRYADSVAVELL